MKTENKNRKSKVMKTKNNVQKTILRFAAVVISFVLISFTVSAQEFWKKLIAGSSFNAIALAMVDHTKEVKHSSDLANASYNYNLVQADEKELTLEPWMLNEFYSNANLISNENVTEEQLELEPWMLDEKLFEVKNSEEDLKLEEWMVSDLVWK